MADMNDAPDASLEKLAEQYSGPVAPMQAPAAEPAAAPQHIDTSPVNVFDDQGELVSIPAHRLEDAKAQGYREASPEDVHDWTIQEKYGSAGQQLATAAEGAASAASFGTSTGLEQALGISTPEAIEGRKEANPIAHGAGQIAGLVGSSLLLPGGGAAGLMTGAGDAAAAGLGLANAATPLARIGSAVVRGAVDNALFQVGDEVSKTFSDPNQSIGSAAANVGLSGLMGGALSGVGHGIVAPLWNATVGGKVGTILDAVAKKTGGIEGDVTNNALDDLINKSGMDIAPEIRARLMDDPKMKALASVLEQSDNTSSGRKFQEAMQEFRSGASDHMADTMGVEAEHIKPEIDKYNSGKELGETLAKEYEEQASPLSKEYDDLKKSMKGQDLEPSQEIKKPADHSNPYNPIPESVEKIPGTIDALSDKINELVQKEGWYQSPKSDIMRGVKSALKELPSVKDVNGLEQYAQRISENMQSDPMNGPLRRAGGMIKSLIRDAASDAIETKLGKEAGAEAVGRFKAVRQAFADQARLKDALQDRLGAKGSVSGYAKSIKEMARTDGESLLNRLSGKNDANLLELLQQKFPQTAEALKQYHTNNLLTQAASKAKPGEALSASHLNKMIEAMSPQLRDFTLGKEAQNKISAIAQLLEKAKDPTHNWSGTARTMNKLMSGLPSSAGAMVGMMASGHPLIGGVLGSIVGALGKDVPDATRLAMLKFMGSSKKIDAQGFGAAVNYIHNVIKGENLTGKAVKEIFRGSKMVLPESALPSEKDREKLDKKISEYQKNPNAFNVVEDKTGHYLPEHSPAIASTTQNAMQYVSSQKPSEVRQSPLDSKPVQSSTAKAAYNSTLNIAEQPLYVLHKVAQGTLTQKDVQDLKSMYPDTYKNLMVKLQEQLIDHVDKGQTIPYQTRMGLSLLSGQDLDSTMTPQSLQAVSSVSQASPAPQQGMAPQPKGSKAAFSKLPSQYMTPGQAREQRQAKS